MRTCAELFADKGDPWVTPEDWTREQQLAQNPRAPSRAQQLAQAFTAGARKKDRKRAEAKPEFVENPRPIPVSDRVRSMQVERDNLKLMLAALGECSRTIKPLATPEAPPMQVVAPARDREMSRN